MIQQVFGIAVSFFLSNYLYEQNLALLYLDVIASEAALSNGTKFRY